MIAATVLRELAETMAGDLLVGAADGVELTVLQRTGFLLDLVGARWLADPLATWMADRRTVFIALRPDLPTAGAERDDRWRLIVNDQVELDQ